MVEVLIIRGVPGSGKSTLAQQFVKLGYRHCEADMYFIQNGVYRFDPEKIIQAHDWCLATAANAVQTGHSVVVSNTFTRHWEYEEYKHLGVPHRVIVATGRWQNIHDCPDWVVQKMRERWED